MILLNQDEALQDFPPERQVFFIDNASWSDEFSDNI